MVKTAHIAFRYINDFATATLRSYAQLFFSVHRVFGAFLLIASLIDYKLGICGLISVVLANMLALLLKFDPIRFKEGLYGYNPLLTGMAIAFDWNQGPAFWPLILLGSVSTVLVTQLLNSFFEKYQLPSLSIPFVLTVWVFTIFIRQSGLLTFNLPEPYSYNPDVLGYHHVPNPFGFSVPESLKVHFATLGGVFFTRSTLAGFLIWLGILIWSRIAFLFTTLTLVIAWFSFNTFLGPDAWLSYLCGSNFIFLSLAIGTFFVVPSRASFIAVLVFIPITLLSHVFLSRVGALFFLPSYTLAFTASTHLFLATIRISGRKSWFIPIEIQQYSPETSVYRTAFFTQKLKNIGKISFRLPFNGTWVVSQGYKGKHTHKGPYANALDFVILDSEMKPFALPGTRPADFYCYNKPVLAAADGWVSEIASHVDENDVAGMDTRQNWGNSIVINHGFGVFSQLSHLKKDSVKVVAGQYVKSGDFLALCGNSGRSPEPHVHFQVQNIAGIGSPTLSYPISYYVSEDNGSNTLHEFEIPTAGQQIRNVEIVPSLSNAFNLLPGKQLSFRNDLNKVEMVSVHTDAFNRTYFLNADSGDIAYFVNDGVAFYFTDYKGKNHGFLYDFYLSGYKVILGEIGKIEVRDSFSLQFTLHPAARVIQDFFAPFFQIVQTRFVSNSILLPNGEVSFHTVVSTYLFGNMIHSFANNLIVSKNELTNLSCGRKKGSNWQLIP